MKSIIERISDFSLQELNEIEQVLKHLNSDPHFRKGGVKSVLSKFGMEIDPINYMNALDHILREIYLEKIDRVHNIIGGDYFKDYQM